MKTPRFWRMVEIFGTRTACRREFQDFLGEEYEVVAGFLASVDGSNGEPVIVDGFPCPKCRRDHVVELVGPGKYRAYAEDDVDRSPCPDITGLTVEDVRQRRVNIEALARAAAVALKLAPEFEGRKDGPWRIGTTSNGRRPVFLSLTSADGSYLRDADFVRAETRGEFLFLTATPRSKVGARFGRDGGTCVALADSVLVAKGSVLGAVATAESLIANGLPAEVAASGGERAALRGKRYAIAEDFSAIEKLGPRRVRYAITALSCQEALRVLVDRGANSRVRALRKQDFCEAVWRRRHPDRPMLADCKPIQFFRVRQRGKTVTVPWYKDVIGTDARGMYWLQL